MTNDEYDYILDSLNSARHRYTRLMRKFYAFGHGIYNLINDEHKDFIDELSIDPVGNFQQNDGSVEDEDQLLLIKFSLSYLGTVYEFLFRSIAAGDADLINGEVLVRTRKPIESEGYDELARLTFNERGDVLDGLKVAAVGADNIASARYCRSFVARLIYDHLVANVGKG